MSVNLRWRMASTNHQGGWVTPGSCKRKPAERIMLSTQTSLDKTLRIYRTIAVYDRSDTKALPSLSLLRNCLKRLSGG